MRHWLCASLLLSSSAYALNMGDIQISSVFNEPLEATIPFKMNPGTTASDYALSLQGLPAGIPPIHVALDSAAPGLIKLTSSQPIAHNYVQFNVLAKTKDDELKQAYTLTFNKKAAPAGPKPLVYGPVKSGETLWNVARAFAEYYDISVNQAMNDLYKDNSRAFVGGKKDVLMAGAFLRLPNQHTLGKNPVAKATPQTQATTPAVAKVQPVSQSVKAAVKKEVQEALPDLAQLDEQGENVALNLDDVTGSLELLVPNGMDGVTLSDAAKNIFGEQQTAFAELLDKIQSELSLSREAIDTERRAKEALQIQLNDMQLQLKALTELIHLKDLEMKSALASASNISGTPGPLFTWDSLPKQTSQFLTSATQNQMVLLLMAVAVASFMIYLWDHLAIRRAQAAAPNISPQANKQSSAIKTQSLQQPPFLLKDIDVYLAHGRYSQAEDMLEQAISHNPNDFDLLYKLFQVYVKSDNRTSYENKISRISNRWKQKYPTRWKRVEDLYERAWPMSFEGHGDGSDGGDDAYEGDPPSDPVQTKLDLAKAYIDIGNHENAVEILIEVVNEGDEAQILAAQMLLSNIKH